MKLSEILTKESIRVPLESKTKGDVLRELVAFLPSAKGAQAQDRIFEAILERESRMSTGIGQGIAIPHGKCALVRSIEMAVGISRTPIDFGALDGNPVVIFFLLASHDDAPEAHIQALAEISRMCVSDEFRDELAAASGAGEVLALLQRQETRFEE